MNYRHQFHAGNFADVVKHALLVALVRALQRKDKGCLFLTPTPAAAGTTSPLPRRGIPWRAARNGRTGSAVWPVTPRGPG